MILDPLFLLPCFKQIKFTWKSQLHHSECLHFYIINIKRYYTLQLQHYQQNNELIYTNVLFMDNK